MIGMAGFQLIQAWNNNAPDLGTMRRTEPGTVEHVGMKQQLIDADFLVGGLALILGVAFGVVSRDMTALLVMLAIFGSVSLWYHAVLAAESR